MTVKRGEIYWVDFDPVRGSEQGGLRPALVVQNDIGNRASPTTVVVAITRTVPPQPYPFFLVVEPGESGFTTHSAVNCSQIVTIQQSGPAGRLRNRAVKTPFGRSGGSMRARWPSVTRRLSSTWH